MIVSHSWLSDFTELSHDIENIADQLTQVGFEVEHIENSARTYLGFVVAEVLTCEKLPKSDKLSICTVNASADEPVYQVVCGAPNVAQGQKIAFAKPGAIVPSNGMVIEERKIRGTVSRGMICSKSELGMVDDIDGIWVLPVDAPVGLELSKYLQKEEITYDISVTPNRGDALSHLGFAREIAANTGNTLLPIVRPTIKTEGAASVSIDIIDKELCPIYAGRVIHNVMVVPSPEWLQRRLESIGIKPKNIIVDATNYVMMHIGQPLHAFDLATIAEKKIIVKTANADQKFATLDGKERILTEKMLTICDGQKPLAIAGVMGGQNSEISDTTTSIFLESAYFLPSSVRKTRTALGISTDSSYRFERGIDPTLVETALDVVSGLILEYSGGIAEPSVVSTSYIANEITIEVSQQKITSILGMEIPMETSLTILTRLGFSPLQIEGGLKVTVPTFRNDIHESIDVIEEIARIYGYNKLPTSDVATIPLKGAIIEQSSLRMPNEKKQVRTFLSTLGLQEILTYNLSDETTSTISNVPPLYLANSVSSEFSTLRTSLIPSMLKVIDRNCKNFQKNVSLFEIGKTFKHTNDLNEKTYVAEVIEDERCCIALTRKKGSIHWSQKNEDVSFYDLKGLIETILEQYTPENMGVMLKEQSENPFFSVHSYDIQVLGNTVGSFGEISPKLAKTYFDIEQPVFVAEISTSILFNQLPFLGKYSPISQFPSMKRDLAMVVNDSVSHSMIETLIWKSGGSYLQQVETFDLYKHANLGEGKKSIAFSLRFQAYHKTLSVEDASSAVEQIVSEVTKELSAEIRTL
jgi:phenylalanyl-tRNA synthetase beta chain